MQVIIAEENGYIEPTSILIKSRLWVQYINFVSILDAEKFIPAQSQLGSAGLLWNSNTTLRDVTDKGV